MYLLERGCHTSSLNGGVAQFGQVVYPTYGLHLFLCCIHFKEIVPDAFQQRQRVLKQNKMQNSVPIFSILNAVFRKEN